MTRLRTLKRGGSPKPTRTAYGLTVIRRTLQILLLYIIKPCRTVSMDQMHSIGCHLWWILAPHRQQSTTTDLHIMMGMLIFANEFLLVAGIGVQYSDLIFTAPANGRYSLASSFTGSQFGIGTVVAVLANDVVLFNSSVTANGQIVPFDTDLSLTTGEMVEFSVGPGGGLQNTGVSATITPLSGVPEPASLTLFCSALAALGLIRRRRKRV